MLTETDRQIVREFQRRLAVIVPVLDLRVFGSRARGMLRLTRTWTYSLN